MFLKFLFAYLFYLLIFTYLFIFGCAPFSKPGNSRPLHCLSWGVVLEFPLCSSFSCWLSLETSLHKCKPHGQHFRLSREGSRRRLPIRNPCGVDCEEWRLWLSQKTGGHTNVLLPFSPSRGLSSEPGTSKETTSTAKRTSFKGTKRVPQCLCLKGLTGNSASPIPSLRSPWQCPGGGVPGSEDCDAALCRGQRGRWESGAGSEEDLG